MNSPSRVESKHTGRNGLICAIVFTACFFASWPFAEMGFIDDWSYTKSAQVFAQTGHLVYNGFATASLGWQIAWGALFIKLFGFSFATVKLSMLPIAIATLFLFYAILLRFKISSRNAVIGTLTLALSPLFMPLAASFMTDVSGLFVISLCLYCCQRALAARTDRASIAWLCLAAATNITGGTARQIAWLGALVMVPSAGWLLRKRRGVLAATAALWVASIAAIMYCMHWFAQQPYSLKETLFPPSDAYAPMNLIATTVRLLGVLLGLLLLVYPVLVPWLGEIRNTSRRAQVIIACALLLWTGIQLLLGWMLPWNPHLLLNEFSPGKIANMHWDTHKFLLPVPASLVISMLVVASTLILLTAVFRKNSSLVEPPIENSGKEILGLSVPFLLSYFVLLVPRSMIGLAFDRYILGMMPFAILGLIWVYQQYVAPNLPASSFAVLAVYALLAVAGTHDWFAWQRARIEAINEVRASGVPRTEIQGGFEYDGWTQIENGGYINHPAIEVPHGAYHPHTDIPQVADQCGLDFAPFTPVVHPKYSVAFGPMQCFLPSTYSPVEYRTWLPPFKQTIYIQEIPPVKR